MQAKGGKFIALFLIFTLLALSGNIFARERRGATLIITKNDGQQIKGELIAVKENSLLLLETNTPWDSLGADVSVNIDDIQVIKIKKKSMLGAGSLFGFLIGGGLGAYWGANWSEVGGGEMALLVGCVMGAVGGLVGGIIGKAASGGYEETIQFEAKSYPNVILMEWNQFQDIKWIRIKCDDSDREDEIVSLDLSN